MAPIRLDSVKINQSDTKSRMFPRAFLKQNSYTCVYVNTPSLHKNDLRHCPMAKSTYYMFP